MKDPRITRIARIAKPLAIAHFRISGIRVIRGSFIRAISNIVMNNLPRPTHVEIAADAQDIRAAHRRPRMRPA
jgi:hypothetical protein